MNEAAARRALLVEAVETAEPPSPSWSADDAAWATRLALHSLPAKADDGAFIAERARHAWQRLAPREAAAAAWLAKPLWRTGWVAAAVLGGLALGLLADSIGSSQRINLLAPPLWAVLAWNAAVYLLLIGHGLLALLKPPAGPGWLLQSVQRVMALRRRLPAGAVWQAFASRWVRLSAELTVARAATLLHAASAALALGLMGGLYLRGLVLDYRAAWESTFLSAATAHAALSALLAPAMAVSGLAMPDVAAFQALREVPGRTGASASAAVWIHLFALTLALGVVLPRALLALWSGWRSRRLAGHIALPLTEPYFAGLLRERDRAGVHRPAAQLSRSDQSIALSLVAHTNVGKTTLARTLLGRDIGEVRDAPHVTEFAEVHTLLQSADGARLCLWDTPGFDDSERIAQRLQRFDNPVSAFLAQTWDRWRDRPFWASQQALRNVRDEADVMLYLVDASDAPEAAAYLASELALLGWIAKPVIVLLNQLGAPREAALEAAEVKRWREHLSRHVEVKAVLPLDAFARCWVQEFALLRAIEAALPAPRRAVMARLAEAWRAERLATFDAAMQALAQSLARLAGMHEVVADSGGFNSRLRQVGQALGIGRHELSPTAQAQQALTAQMAAELQASTAQLIALHGLEGRAQGEILARLASHYETRLKLGEGRAAMWGGMVTGALGALRQPRARHRSIVARLECRGARRDGRRGAAALSRRRPLRPWPRRVDAGRITATLARRGGGRARAAARRTERVVGRARCSPRHAGRDRSASWRTPHAAARGRNRSAPTPLPRRRDRDPRGRFAVTRPCPVAPGKDPGRVAAGLR